MTERPKIVASIEARMTSSRLPGKMLADIVGRPAILRVLERLRRARRLDSIVVATTSNGSDDDLASWVENEGIACFRGDEQDVLGRVVEAHRKMGTDIIVEVTGDCVLIDPEVIDWGVDVYLTNSADVVTNVIKQSFPLGVDVQVFAFAALAEVAATVTDEAVREHVSLHFYENPDRYRVCHLPAPARYYGPEIRLVLDYAEDLDLVRNIYQRLEPLYPDGFGTPEIIRLLKASPSLLDINRHCVEKPAR